MSDIEQILDGVEPEAVEVQPEPQAEEQPAEVEAAQPEPAAQEEQPSEEPTVEPASAPEQSEPTVPASVVGGLRAELRELKAQLAQKPEEPAPDFYEDPTGAVQHQIAPVQSQMQNVRLDMSEELTVSMLDAQGKNGRAVVDAAMAALQASQDRAAYQSIMQEKNPYGALVKWHGQQKVAQEIGADPDAWMAKKEAEISERIRKELNAEMVAKQAKDAAAKAAPSMADVTGTGGANPSTWNGPAKLDDLL